MFNHISEIPIFRGGRVRAESWDYGHLQNNNLVYFNGAWHLYWKGLKKLPETFYPVAIGLAYVYPGFNGYDVTTYGSNPIIDFGTGSWTSTILDSYVNTAVRWVEPGADVVTAGNFEIGRVYEIKTVGTTSFTSIGASSNTVGVKFIATGAGSGTGDAYKTDGARHGDISAVVFNNKVHLYINVYDYNNGNTNRVALMTSTDGYTFTYVQEITFGGTNFGATIGPMFVANNKIWMLCGSPKELRSSDDGLTWASHGTAISLSTDAGAANYRAMPVGRGFVRDNYAYAAIPMSRIETDWPEGIGMWRCLTANLGTSNFEWEPCANNPVILRAPTMGGIWQLNPTFLDNDIWAFYNTWGIVGFNNINTSTVNTLRNTPYYGSDSTTFKHIGVAKGKAFVLNDWSSYLTEGANYRIKNGRRYLQANSDDSVSVVDAPGVSSIWTATKQSGYWMFAPTAYPTKALTMETGSNYRANNRKLQVLTYSTKKSIGFDGTSASVVSVANDTITFTAHGFVTGDEVQYHTSGSAVGGLTNANTYYIIKIDNNTIKLATSAANAVAGTAINLTGLSGETTNTITTNLKFHWQISRVSREAFYIVNRETSLAVSKIGTQLTTLLGEDEWWEFIRA